MALELLREAESVASVVSQMLLDIFSVHPHLNLEVPSWEVSRKGQVSSRQDLKGMGNYLHRARAPALCS